MRANCINMTELAPNDFRFTYEITANNAVIDTVILNVYQERQVTDNKGQLLYDWDDNNGSKFGHLMLVLEAYETSELFQKYPLIFDVNFC